MTTIYLCAPYSHWNPIVRWLRVRAVNRKAAELMDMGFTVFSPISHSHPISRYTQAHCCDPDFWVRQDLVFMPVCDEVWVLRLRGWRNSRGIRVEIEEAERLGKKVMYI